MTILTAHDDFVVIDKPPGLLSVPGRGPDKADCASARVAARFPHATGPLICHRLDMDTSGLIVFALNPDAQRHLSMQFEARTVAKRYIALLDGRVERDHGEIDLPILFDYPNRPRKIIDDRGKPSQTHWRTIGAGKDAIGPWTRVEFTPITGRSHQLRVHAAAPFDPANPASGLGAPIRGDSLYNPRAGGGDRLHLHASRLAFDHPTNGSRIECHSVPMF
ncbi:MAG: RluA family pseudouridine synthase [Phycisphaeraceae bacterium]|nr:RluA family pseudouridine synthase [Phycisphaeraceae bacterium]MCB9847087.1 RluA family pseudouridine synthase [Phycisphaeraceae bacterium]